MENEERKKKILFGIEEEFGSGVSAYQVYLISKFRMQKQSK